MRSTSELLSETFAGRGFLGHVGLLGGRTIVSQQIVVLGSPLITRLYTPSGLGRFGPVIAFLTFCTSFITLRCKTAIVAGGGDEEAAHLVLAVPSPSSSSARSPAASA